MFLCTCKYIRPMGPTPVLTVHLSFSVLSFVSSSLMIVTNVSGENKESLTLPIAQIGPCDSSTGGGEKSG
ncbi:hypothetical protein QJS04_geneDACA009090 [Acorus gramineus]|uniref:Uncharacterized protein n=1 Tax=Acorus gramineus TaxID=55184 RepID=A0AAV9AQE2_ACOGR|nr:hypothetical protein QJS04_geneDACA009090 [Acorus gramineus]